MRQVSQRPVSTAVTERVAGKRLARQSRRFHPPPGGAFGRDEKDPGLFNSTRCHRRMFTQRRHFTILLGAVKVRRKAVVRRASTILLQALLAKNY